MASPGTSGGATRASTIASVDAAGTTDGVSNPSPVLGRRGGPTGIVEEEEAMVAAKNQQNCLFTTQRMGEKREIRERFLLNYSFPFS